MEFHLTSLVVSPLFAGTIGFGIAIGLLALLIALATYGGLFYSVPRFLLKWWSRRALRAL